MRLLGFCIFCFFVAMPVKAAVIISEIAWMGTATSANDEWIELYNSGPGSVSVDGWQLTDDMGVDITLSGTIPVGAYAVLERTDDGSAPGSAFLIYTGALPNTGAVLSLFNAQGALVDRVVGGDDWSSVGGDNATKETAQYTESGWVTAIATPGRIPEGTEEESDPEPEEEDNEEEEEAVSGTETGVTTLHLEQRALSVGIERVREVYVNQEVVFTAEPDGLADGILNALTHEWNFGDAYTKKGEEVVHRYRYPGEYVVTLLSTYKDYEASSRERVVVLPVTLSLAQRETGELQIHNNAKYEIDVSGYELQGVRTLGLPSRTILLPNATLTIPSSKFVVRHGNNVRLFDAAGKEVAALSSRVHEINPDTVAMPETSPVMLPEQVSVEKENFSFGKTSELNQDAVVNEVVLSSSTQAAAVIEAVGDTSSEKHWPYYALFGVIGFGVLAVAASRVKTDV